MELRVLRYFLMVAREENITRAAEHLHITQPTLSRQLQQLEEELGCKLTEDGMRLKKHAQDIVTLADRTEREFAKQQEIAGEIVFGCGEARCMDDLAGYMERFQKMYPQVQYELYTANADDVKERLDKGLVDIGLLSEPVDISKYNFIRLKQKDASGAEVYTPLISPRLVVGSQDIPIVFPRIRGAYGVENGTVEVVDVEKDAVIASYPVSFFPVG